MKDIVTDLTDRLALLHVRYEVVFHGPAPADPARYASLARLLESGLHEADEQAVQIARGVVDPADLARPEFWSTPLGRLMFRVGGFKGATCTQTVAAGVLDCSRQWVSAMVAENKIKRAADGGVYADEVRAILKARIDRLVK